MRIFFDNVRLDEESVSHNRKKKYSRQPRVSHNRKNRAAGHRRPHIIEKNVHLANDNLTLTQFLYTAHFG